MIGHVDPLISTRSHQLTFFFHPMTPLLTLVLPGGWLPLPWRFVSGRKKLKRKWPRASKTSLLRPLRSFCEKSWGTPWDGGRVSRQSSKVGGWLPPQNILSRHFEKYLHGMVLKLSGYVRNTISLLYMQKKPRVKSRYLELF